MASSLKASQEGLLIVDIARRRKGWTKTRTLNWWQSARSSQATLRRFWRGIAIDRDTFIAICQTVGITDWASVADLEFELAIPSHQILGQAIQTINEDNSQGWKHDWGDAPDVSGFYGRVKELETLEKWIAIDQCKLVTILGMGGIGKTALTVEIADRIQDRFDYLIWRSLQSAPSLQNLLVDLLAFFTQSDDSTIVQDISRNITSVMDYLRKHRCLLILDEMESIFYVREDSSYSQCGSYRIGCEDYGNFFKRLAIDRHQSCAILTSREKPEEVANHEGKDSPVRSLSLRGLEVEDAKDIFRAKGFTGIENGLAEVIQLYGGSPLALKVTATTIQEVFNNNVGEFLGQNTIIIGDRLRALLQQQTSSLSNLEREIVYWLAIAKYPISIDWLRSKLLSTPSASTIIQVFSSLERRSLLEKIIEENKTLFSLQPLVMKYAIEELADQITNEILEGINIQDIYELRNLRLIDLQSFTFPHNTFTNTTANNNTSILLKRFQRSLYTSFRSEKAIALHFRTLLNLLEGKSSVTSGYTSSNIDLILTSLEINQNCIF
jgi:hypothetical protein